MVRNRSGKTPSVPLEISKRNVRADCSKTVPKPKWFSSFGLSLSEEQIPQIVENNESGTDRKELLEATGVRPRQVRYQAALRPDMISTIDSKALSNFMTCGSPKFCLLIKSFSALTGLSWPRGIFEPMAI